jgi:hypothetical protein
MPFPDLPGKQWRLKDELGNFVYDRNGDDLVSRGLYLDIAGWNYHLFDMQPVQSEK